MSDPASSLPDVETDLRFATAIRQFNDGEFYDAADGFEQLFFEAVRDEVEFVRLFLQLSVGAYHAYCAQRRPAVERLHEALLALDRVTDPRGFDLVALRASICSLMEEISRGDKPAWPRIKRAGE